MIHIKPKILVILGPTASGKTKLAVSLAREFDGEIVSADSRQVYRGLDVGTGKDLKDYRLEIPNSASKNIIHIPYHLIDVASPKKQFDLARYQKLAFKAIDDILKRGKLPILAGGSGLYLQAVVDNYKLAVEGRDIRLRKSLEKLAAEELYLKLSDVSPKMAEKLNPSDKKNKRRLIRYLEITAQGRSFKCRAGGKKYDTLIIGLNPPPEILKKSIANRLIKRLKHENLVGEVENLRQAGLGWDRLESFGLEYKYVSWYLRKKICFEEMVEMINLASRQFSRRQLSWFRRWERQGAEINWRRDNSDVGKLIRQFLMKGRPIK